MAFPDQEKEAVTLVTSQPTVFLLQDSEFLFLSVGDEIFRADLATWALTSEQVPELLDNSDDGGDDLTGDIGGLAMQGDSLFAPQTDGDLLTIDLTAITEDPETTDIIEGQLGPAVSDPEEGDDDDQVYFLDTTNNALVIFDISDGDSRTVPITDSAGTAVAPVSLLFLPFPTDSSNSSTDKIYVTTANGFLAVVNEGEASITSRIALSETNEQLPALATTPGGDFLLVVNSTNTSVHAINTESDAEVDTDPNTSGTNPISLSQNASLQSVVIAEVTDPEDIYAFVTGSQGLSVIDLNITGGSFGEPEVIDFNDEGATDDEDDPLELSSVPGFIVATDDGYILTANSNATISVLSDNPFVTISGTSLGSDSLGTDDSFTVTFQADEIGTYRVLVGGNRTGTGTEVTSGTVDAADTDVTTASIAYDSSLFSEGTNRIFVFVSDSEGNEGRDAVDITVDTPPPAFEIVSTGFGNQKVYVTFERVDVSDMDHYAIYVDEDPDTVSTKTDAETTVSQPTSGDSVDAKVTGLVNGTIYFIGIEAVDQGGNVSTRIVTLSDGSRAAATPERTIGLAQSLGESGCALVPGRSAGEGSLFWIGAGLFLLVGMRRPKIFLTLLFLCVIPIAGSAKERTPQWWSLEFKGGAWMPVNSTTKDFLGACCEPAGTVEFGFLYRSKFGFEVGTGYVGAGGAAVGVSSGRVSRDGFSFTMIPIQNSFAFRADFKEDQLFVPYTKAGLDYLIFRENTQGTVTKGLKLGLHLAGGVQILMDRIEDLSETMEQTLGVNDVYLVLEGRYAWVDGFGGSGVDLSSLTFSGGFLFEF